MRILIWVIIVFSLFFSYSSYATEIFNFSGKFKCELSATFIIFDFDNKIAVRNNYNHSQYNLSNYEVKKNKFKKTVYTFSWYDAKKNFLGYWVLSNDTKNIKEIKFDKEGEIYSISSNCSTFNNNNIGELVWD